MSVVIQPPEATATATAQIKGRFRVSPHSVDCEAEDLALGGAEASSSAPAVDQANKVESLHKLQAILETQQHLFTKTWEDMKDQVYRALLHKDANVPLPQTATRPNTPTSTYSSASCRTPPFIAAGDSQQSSSRHRAKQERNARENTLQMWSHLGSTLREVVQRNEQLEEENRRLRVDVARIQQQIADVQALFLHGGHSVPTFDSDVAAAPLPPRPPSGLSEQASGKSRKSASAPPQPPKEAPVCDAVAPKTVDVPAVVSSGCATQH